jgi:hypothetical protein
VAISRWGLAGMVGLSFAGSAVSPAVHAETINIAIRYQSMCIDTYTAGIIVKKLGLLENHLPHDGRYAGVTYNVVRSDHSSGGPITNDTVANKLAFGVMGDHPLSRGSLRGRLRWRLTSITALLATVLAYRSSSGTARKASPRSPGSTAFRYPRRR